MSSFVPNPDYVTKTNAEEVRKEDAIAIEVMKLAAASLCNQPKTDLEWQKRLEATWQWWKTENWTPPA